MRFLEEEEALIWEEARERAYRRPTEKMTQVEMATPWTVMAETRPKRRAKMASPNPAVCDVPNARTPRLASTRKTSTTWTAHANPATTIRGGVATIVGVNICKHEKISPDMSVPNTTVDVGVPIFNKAQSVNAEGVG